jgi:hypothetical protein
MKIENQILKLLIDSDVNITNGILAHVRGIASEIGNHSEKREDNPDKKFEISWKDVDEKYKYHAYDYTGSGYFYTLKPYFLEYDGYWREEYTSDEFEAIISKNYLSNLSLEDVRNSLRSRPKN